MMKKIVDQDIQYLTVFILCLFSLNCQGPLEGDNIEFITPNVYNDLSSEAAQIVIRTEKSNWTFQDVQYNDTIVDLSTGKIHKVGHDGDITDPSFSYDTRVLNNNRITKITGSFFSITSESPMNKNEPTVITVEITENRSKEKRVLHVQLLNLDTGGYFRIEQNP